MTKSNKLTLWIFVALIIGVLTGVLLNGSYPPGADGSVDPALVGILDNVTILTDIFLRLIKMIIAPLVFSTLVVGVAKLGDIKAVGRIGGKTMLWFISASFVSLLLGCLLVNLFQPGTMMQLELPPADAATGIDKAAWRTQAPRRFDPEPCGTATTSTMFTTHRHCVMWMRSSSSSQHFEALQSKAHGRDGCLC
jgi:Na+/H+-dicarboxylate symporter